MWDYFTKHHLTYQLWLMRDKYLYPTLYARKPPLKSRIRSLQWCDNSNTNQQNRRHYSNWRMGPRSLHKMNNFSTRHIHKQKPCAILYWTKIFHIKWINALDPSQALTWKILDYNKISQKVTNKINLFSVVFLSYQKWCPS